VVLAVLIMTVALAAVVLSRRPGRAPEVDDGEQVLVTAQWAVEAFGEDQAFALAEVQHQVIAQMRRELAARLDEQSRFLSQVPVTVVWAHQLDHGVVELNVQFADGSAMRVRDLDPLSSTAAMALVGTDVRELRLESIDVVGAQAALHVCAAGQLRELRAGTVELEVPRRSVSQRRSVLRRLRRRAR